ncbi:glycoprotein [Vesiculovirus malpais]|uniref:Glycoprotein n=1 Tax=Vesiculovirus malpais TaxID=1972570 RepID=M4VNB9_9RHAB|nr:glycoprotein [Vesiculovirus malpais]AGI04017.1 glycoprotein [Vesiculovirus malpais]
MESLLKAICVLLLIHCSRCDLPIVFPDQKELLWNPVLKTNRYCPQTREIAPLDKPKTLKITTGVPVRSPKEKIEGYLCHSGKWVTTCDYRWYGAKYVTHSIHHLKPTDQMCRDAISQYNGGTLLNPGFPPEVCGYASVTDSELIITLITPHTVGVDDYRGLWIDPSFPNGECNSIVCETIHNSTKWVSKGEMPTDICQQTFTTIKMDVSYPSDTTSQGSLLSFHSPYHPHISGKDICKMSYCGSNGLRLPNGEWFSIINTSKIGNKNLIDFFSPCKAGVEVRSTLQSEGSQTIAWETQRMLDYALCQNTWDKFERGEPLSPLDLNYLAPRVPGKGMAYTIINNTLHSSHAVYRRVWIEGPIIGEMKGKIESATGVAKEIWAQWFEFGQNKIGPNGVIKTNDGIKFPLYAIGTGLIDQDIHELSEVSPMDHPHLVHAKKYVSEDDEIYFGDTGVSHNPVEIFSGWFTNWKEGLMKFSILVLSILIFYVVIRLVMCIPLKCKKERKPRLEFELQPREWEYSRA